MASVSRIGRIDVFPHYFTLSAHREGKRPLQIETLTHYETGEIALTALPPGPPDAPITTTLQHTDGHHAMLWRPLGLQPGLA